MKSKSSKYISYLILLFYTQSLAQTVGVTQNTSNAFEGYTLFAPFDNNIAYLIDNCGEIVHQWNTPDGGIRSTYLLKNGDLLYYASNPSAIGQFNTNGGLLRRYDWNNNVVWSYNYVGSDFVQHHDIEFLPNGNILLVTFKVRSAEQVLLKGKTNFGNNIWTTKIDEIEPVGANSINVIWEWEVWNHLVQDVDPEISNYAILSDNPGKIDINYINNSYPDLLHVNSISYNKTFDLILLSSKYYGEIYIIDHSTTTLEATTSKGGNFGKGGEILYRWGNPEVYDRGNAADRKLFEQHDAEWIKDDLPFGGSILVFNNGDGRPGGNYSSADVLVPVRNAVGEFVVDDVNKFGPLSATKSYFSVTNPGSVFSRFGSSSQILPNGNVVMCSNNQGLIVEISQKNEIVWEYKNPVEPAGIATQGDVDNSGSRWYRAYKYPIYYEAFNGRDVNPKGTIEFGTDTISTIKTFLNLYQSKL